MGDSLQICGKTLPPETRMIALPDAENRLIVSSLFWTKRRNVTDGQTDRQTDRITLASTAVCIESRFGVLGASAKVAFSVESKNLQIIL